MNGFKSLWQFIAKEFSAPRNYILGGLGIVFLLISTVLDYKMMFDEVTKAGVSAAKHVPEPWYLHIHTWSSFSRELGFAFLIAMLIIVFVEKRSREEQVELTKEGLSSVSNNVLAAVLGITVPKTIVRQVMGTVFSTPIVRHDVRLALILEPLPKEFGALCNKCVLLKIENSYELENITGNTVDWGIKLIHPLPPFPDPILKGLATVNNISFEDSPLSLDEIQAGASSDNQYVKRYEWKRKLQPGKKFRVSLSYTLVKEISDNELWTSLLSSTSLEVVVDVRITDHLWDLGTRHSGIIKALDASQQEGPYTEKKVTFRCEEALLPHQGVIFWWRPKRQLIEDDKGKP